MSSILYVTSSLQSVAARVIDELRQTSPQMALTLERANVQARDLVAALAAA